MHTLFVRFLFRMSVIRREWMVDDIDWKTLEDARSRAAVSRKEATNSQRSSSDETQVNEWFAEQESEEFHSFYVRHLPLRSLFLFYGFKQTFHEAGVPSCREGNTKNERESKRTNARIKITNEETAASYLAIETVSSVSVRVVFAVFYY